MGIKLQFLVIFVVVFVWIQDTYGVPYKDYRCCGHRVKSDSSSESVSHEIRRCTDTFKPKRCHNNIVRPDISMSSYPLTHPVYRPNKTWKKHCGPRRGHGLVWHGPRVHHVGHGHHHVHHKKPHKICHKPTTRQRRSAECKKSTGRSNSKEKKSGKKSEEKKSKKCSKSKNSGSKSRESHSGESGSKSNENGCGCN